MGLRCSLGRGVVMAGGCRQHHLRPASVLCVRPLELPAQHQSHPSQWPVSTPACGRCPPEPVAGVHPSQWPASTPASGRCPPEPVAGVHPSLWPESTPASGLCQPQLVAGIHTSQWMVSMQISGRCPPQPVAGVCYQHSIT